MNDDSELLLVADSVANSYTIVPNETGSYDPLHYTGPAINEDELPLGIFIKVSWFDLTKRFEVEKLIGNFNYEVDKNQPADSQHYVILLLRLMAEEKLISPTEAYLTRQALKPHKSSSQSKEIDKGKSSGNYRSKY